MVEITTIQKPTKLMKPTQKPSSGFPLYVPLFFLISNNSFWNCISFSSCSFWYFAMFFWISICLACFSSLMRASYLEMWFKQTVLSILGEQYWQNFEEQSANRHVKIVIEPSALQFGHLNWLCPMFTSPITTLSRIWAIFTVWTKQIKPYWFCFSKGLCNYPLLDYPQIKGLAVNLVRRYR